MAVVKYQLRQGDIPFAVGTTDLKDSCGSSIDTGGCICMLVESGYAVAVINFKRRALRKGDFVLLFYDSTLSMERISPAFSVRFASFEYWLAEEAVYKPLSVHFWDTIYGNPVFRPADKESEMLVGWWHHMEWISNMKDAGIREEMLKNNIRNLLIATDAEIAGGKADVLRNERSHAWGLITRFFKLISVHCHDIREVRFYADKLSITTTYLYKLCRKNFQLSPKDFIDRQTVTEIKTYLVNTDLSVKQIAVNMQFEDVSYMCRYFRRHTGLSLVEYRKGAESERLHP